MAHDGKITSTDLRAYKESAQVRHANQSGFLLGKNVLEKVFKKNDLVLESFWDKTFAKDIYSLKVGASLVASIDDVATRTGAYILHTETGASVGVIVNPGLGDSYREFTSMLMDVVKKSRFKVIYLEKGELFKGRGERHYFKIRIPRKQG